MIVYLLWDRRDYYADSLMAVYADKAEAERHLQAIADAKRPYPGSERLSVEDFTEHDIEEQPVMERFERGDLRQWRA